MMRAIRRRSRGVAIAAVIALGIASSAIGYWSSSGTGSATTTLANPLALTLSLGTPSTQISPGATSAVATVASNPNTYPVQISSIALDTGQGTGGFAVDGGHSGCALATLGFTTQTNGGSGWTVPAKVGGTPGSLSIALPGALTMSAGAADACQGATFSVYLAATI